MFIYIIFPSSVDLEKQNKVAIVARFPLWLMEMAKVCLEQENVG